MKQLSIIAALAVAGAALPAVAALPPEWQRVAELKAILDDAAVVKAFDGSAIDRVEYVRRDLYRVTAGECFLYVTIVGKPMPNGMVGARRFDVVAGKVDCPAD